MEKELEEARKIVEDPLEVSEYLEFVLKDTANYIDGYL